MQNYTQYCKGFCNITLKTLCILFFLSVLWFDIGALHFLGRHSTTFAMSPALIF